MLVLSAAGNLLRRGSPRVDAAARAFRLVELPFVDAHAVEVAASPEAAWDALVPVLRRGFGGGCAEAFARAVGCEHRSVAPDFPAEDATIVGFRVGASERGRLLALAGRHRFSRYVLVFRVEPAARGARVVAETRAEFPGTLGRLYRSAVIGTGFHARVVRRLLAAAKRRAELPT